MVFLEGLVVRVEVGLRVVRGPDWCWQDQDGGEGHVGTVIAVGTGENNIPNQTAVVQWDLGFQANYRVGFKGHYDLRVFDSSPAGVKHPENVCNVCKKTDIPGSMWRDFHNSSLCQQCYMTDQQEVDNIFYRCDFHFAPGVKVPQRSASRKVESLGIFPGATVVRECDWRWGNQDGGEGMQGTVQELEDCNDCESSNSVVKVTWTSGRTNVYRLGHQGKVDLKCVQETSGGSYYPDHLPILGFCVASRNSGDIAYTTGDRVRVCVDIDTLNEMQEGHGGWNLSMEQYIDNVGRVLRVTESGDVCVQYSGCSSSWTFNARALTKVEAEPPATATLGLKHEEDASVVGSSTIPNPRQLTGRNPGVALTVAERLAGVELPVTSYQDNVQSAALTTSLATSTGTDESEVTGMTPVDLSDVQSHSSEMAATTLREPTLPTPTDQSVLADLTRSSMSEVDMTVDQPQTSETTATPVGSGVKWISKSERYKSQLSELHELDKTDLVSLVQFHISSTSAYNIGKGSYGAVFLGFIRSDWREVAIKRIQNIDQAVITNELNILLKVQDHQNIVPYRMIDQDKDFTYIASELCDYTLDEWLKKDTLHPPGEWGPTAAGLTKDLLGGLAYLHSTNQKIFHRDIKPTNLFIVYTTKWHLKVADFGISRTLAADESSLCTGPAGTRCWKAKEVLECNSGEHVRYKPSTDIQPAGMVTFFILTKGKHPYSPNWKDFEIEPNIINDKPDLSAVTDLVASDMLKSMLAADPTERPSAAQLLRHPFFWSEDERYQFLATVGNQAEVANSHAPEYVNCHVRNFLEAAKYDITPQGDWKAVAGKLNKLHPRFRRNYKQTAFIESICKLLRTLRNIQDHFDEQSEDAKADLGGTCYPYRFFDTELPHLFIRTYNIISKTAGKPDDWTQREQLKVYFSHPL